MQKMLLKAFDSVAMAELTKNILKENGIRSEVRNRGAQFPGVVADSLGADLMVDERDAAAAAEVMLAYNDDDDQTEVSEPID